MFSYYHRHLIRRVLYTYFATIHPFVPLIRYTRKQELNKIMNGNFPINIRVRILGRNETEANNGK